jgi:hypothetical protein
MDYKQAKATARKELGFGNTPGRLSKENEKKLNERILQLMGKDTKSNTIAVCCLKGVVNHQSNHHQIHFRRLSGALTSTRDHRISRRR